MQRTYGGGGKPIGAEHENFGIGAKVTLLPWNREGIVVISYKDGVASMIRLAYDADDERVRRLRLDHRERLRRRGADGRRSRPRSSASRSGASSTSARSGSRCRSGESRTTPPEHGTIVLLVGNTPLEDTILGDPDRPEERAVHFAAAYLNTRIWQVPDDMTITVDVPGLARQGRTGRAHEPSRSTCSAAAA